MALTRQIRLHGDERELTIIARDSSKNVLRPAELVTHLLAELRQGPSLSSTTKQDGWFLVHGHVYREQDGLLEAGCAETLTPLGATMQGALLRRQIAMAAEKIRHEHRLTKLIVSQHNTAYSPDNPEHCTAGHFNITRYRPATALMPDLGTFLCVLPCVSGGGGLDTSRFDFTLSVRASRCCSLTSNHTQRSRGLVDAKDMPAANGTRQQLLGIDNLQSHRQTRCVYTAINLLVTCLETHRDTAPRIALANPINDLQRMATGANIAYLYLLSDGRRMTAPEILRVYLEWIERHIEGRNMPEWARTELAHVSELVDALEQGGIEALEGLCDHANLWKLWNRVLQSCELTPEIATEIGKLMRGAQPTGPSLWGCLWGEREPDLHALISLANKNPLIPHPKQSLRNYMRAVQGFCQIAYEYGDIMPGGLFDEFRETGLAMPGAIFSSEELDAGLNVPPEISEGRCHYRAKTILELAAEGETGRADWDHVECVGRGRLNLEQYVPSKEPDWEAFDTAEDSFVVRTRRFNALTTYLSERESTEELVRRAAERYVGLSGEQT